MTTFFLHSNVFRTMQIHFVTISDRIENHQIVSMSEPRRKKLDLRQNLFRIPAEVVVDLGLQWNFVGVDPVDLDASCVAMGKNGECLDVLFFNNLTAESSAGVYMRHSGDNTTGEDTGEDDETLHFVFSNVPDDVAYLMVCVTSYTGADFTLVERASCNVRNATTGELVGSFQLGLIGAHTATLLCCISRVEPTHEDPKMYWDLRELGLPGTGFTFVEVIPMMQELISVPEAQREAMQRLLPDYSLVKDPAMKSRDVVPSVMKFAIGWDGDNDVDCFLVLLDEKDEYIDHVYAKTGKLKSREGACVHSGDKLNGFAGTGDDEFIDIDVNRLRKEVHRVFFVVSLFSGFALSLGDVPNAYVRMQNRAPTEGFMEIDRLNLAKKAGKSQAAVLSALVRKDAVRFEYVRMHEPVRDSRDYVDVLPWLRIMSSFLSQRVKELQPVLASATSFRFSSSTILGSQSAPQQSDPQAAASPEQQRLQTYWNTEWPERRAQVADTSLGVELRFRKVTDLGPLEPHQFACHIESWVCDRKCKDTFKSSICYNRDAIEWDEGDPKSRCVFSVHLYDRVRILVYEHSVAGYADVDISNVIERGLLSGEDVVLHLSLLGKDATGEVEVVCRHVPLQYVTGNSEESSWLHRYVCSVM